VAVAPRVLHVLRADHGGHVGGDLVQLSKTVAMLRDAGVHAMAATVDEAPAQVDIVHLYNLQRPVELRRDRVAAARRWPAASVVLSPVWWPMQLRRMATTPDRPVVAKAAKTAAKTAASWPSLRRALSAVDVVLPNSHAELHALQRAFRLPHAARGPERWAVVPNGVDLTDWPEGRATSDERSAVLHRFGLAADTAILVACVARIEPVKNQAALVRAVAEVPGAGLVLIGPEGHRGYAAVVRDEASRLGDGRVAFAGPMAAADIASVLRAVDVHVLASFRETPGLATLEAAAVGCEVVVTADGSAPEYLGDDAHVADPFRPASIAAAILEARSDPRQPSTRRRAEGHTWEVAARALVDAYRRVPAWSATRR
jgi:glycosyltransferase involved in cell wall biosynthesis